MELLLWNISSYKDAQAKKATKTPKQRRKVGNCSMCEAENCSDTTTSNWCFPEICCTVKKQRRSIRLSYQWDYHHPPIPLKLDSISVRWLSHWFVWRWSKRCLVIRRCAVVLWVFVGSEVISGWPPSSVLSARRWGSRAITISRCSTIFCKTMKKSVRKPAEWLSVVSHSKHRRTSRGSKGADQYLIH